MGVNNALSRLTTWTTPRATRKTQTIPVPGGRLKTSPGNWPTTPAGRETPVTGSDSGYEPSRTNRGTEGPRRENRRMRPLEERALPATAAGVVPPPSARAHDTSSRRRGPHEIPQGETRPETRERQIPGTPTSRHAGNRRRYDGKDGRPPGAAA